MQHDEGQEVRDRFERGEATWEEQLQAERARADEAERRRIEAIDDYCRRGQADAKLIVRLQDEHSAEVQEWNRISAAAAAQAVKEAEDAYARGKLEGIDLGIRQGRRREAAIRSRDFVSRVEEQRLAAFESGYQCGRFDALPAHCACFSCEQRTARAIREAVECYKLSAGEISAPQEAPLSPEEKRVDWYALCYCGAEAKTYSQAVWIHGQGSVGPWIGHCNTHAKAAFEQCGCPRCQRELSARWKFPDSAEVHLEEDPAAPPT